MLERIEHGPVVELRLARPPANALSPELIARLGEALSTLSDEVGAVVLSGREGMFSAGLDVPAFLAAERADVRRAWSDFFDVMRSLAVSPRPVACALTGHAPAGGCVLALFCDWRVMARGSFKIGLNEVQVGVRMPAPIHAAARHVVGARQAERMCATAELFDAEEALRIGLVDELVPPADVVPRAVEWASGLLGLPSNALRGTREVARRSLLRPFEELDDGQLERFMDEWFSAETQGALRALVERLAERSS